MIEVQETRDPRSILRAKREIAKFNRRNHGDLNDAANFMKGLNWPILANFAAWGLVLLWWLV